jgi:hypothetical protein
MYAVPDLAPVADPIDKGTGVTTVDCGVTVDSDGDNDVDGNVPVGVTPTSTNIDRVHPFANKNLLALRA